MKVCNNCYIPMVSIISFQPNRNGRHERFCKCPKCKVETKHIKVNDSDLSFREYTNREIRKVGR